MIIFPTFSCAQVSVTLAKAALLFFVAVSLWGSMERCMSFRVTKTWGCDSVLPSIWWGCSYLVLKNKSPHESVIWARFGRDRMSLLHLESAGMAQETRGWRHLKQGFSVSVLLAFWTGYSLLWRIVKGRMFSSILSLYPLMPVAPLCSCNQKLSKVPSHGKGIGNTACRWEPMPRVAGSHLWQLMLATDWDPSRD